MKLVVACPLPESALSQLKALTRELVYLPEANAADLKPHVADVGLLIVLDQRVPKEFIAAAPGLQMVIRAGAGPGEIAVEEASMQGIFIVHCPDRDSAAVAELAFGLLLALDRQIVEHTLSLRAGRWQRGLAAQDRGLAGRRLGIVGMGAEGQAIAARAQAFGMPVLAWCPTISTLPPTVDGVSLCSYPVELAQSADAICVTQFVANDPAPVVDAAFLEGLARDALFVHVGAAAAVDEAALLAAAERGLRIGVDTFETLPVGDDARFRSRLLALPNVIGTPHIARETRQAADAVAAEVVRLARAFLISGEVQNCVNLLERSPATWQLVLRVRDQVGVMASILDAIRADGVNAEEITSRVFTGAKAAWCTIALDERPSREALDAVRALPDVMHLELRAVV